MDSRNTTGYIKDMKKDRKFMSLYFLSKEAAASTKNSHCGTVPGIPKATETSP